jgi:hypothetical protein
LYNNHASAGLIHFGGEYCIIIGYFFSKTFHNEAGLLLFLFSHQSKIKYIANQETRHTTKKTECPDLIIEFITSSTKNIAKPTNDHQLSVFLFIEL